MNVHGQWVLPWMATNPATPTASATPTMPMQAVQMTSMLGQQQLLNKMLTVNGNAGLPQQQNNSLVQQQQQQQQQHHQQQQHQQQQYVNLNGFAIHPSMLTTTNPAYFGLSALGSQPQGMAAAAAAAAAAQIQSQHTATSLLASQAMVASKSPLLRTPLFASKDAASQLLASNTVPTSSSIHCSTPEATANMIRGSSVTNNSLENSNVSHSMTMASSPIVVNSMPSTLAGSNMSSAATMVATKRKLIDESEAKADVKKAKLETKALKAKRPGFTDERYNETSYFHDSNLRKVYPYYFTFTTFTKGRWVGERILDVFAREFRAHPAEEYERCIKAGTLTVNYEKVDIDYRLKHNDLLANIVHRHEVPVSSEEIKIVHIDDDLVVVNKPASIPVHPCGRYRHNTVVFILAKEHGLKNLRTIHRLDRLTSGLLLFGRNPKKAREMEQQIRTRQVQKEYVCRVDGEFPAEPITCKEPIEVVSYKIGVCKVSNSGKDCHTDFHRLSFNGKTSVVLCKPRTGRMHQIRVHLQYLGYPVVNDPLYNHDVFGPQKGKGGLIGKTDEQLIQDLISIHNAENWLGMDDNLPAGGGGEPPRGFRHVASAGTTVGGNVVQPVSGSPKDKQQQNNTKNNNMVHQQRSDTPDSAVTDLHSIPTSTDSPSSSSPVSCNGDSNNIGNGIGNVGLQHLLDNVGTSIKCMTTARNNGLKDQVKVTIATQTGIEEADRGFDISKLSVDPHCYECKVKYRDPRPKDLVMFLHAWTYSGPDWHYQTELPNWAKEDWDENAQEFGI